MITALTLARKIGAILDSKMSMKTHMSTLPVCKSCYCHLSNLRKGRHCLTQEAAFTLVHAFISSNIEPYECPLPLWQIPKYLMNKYWWIQTNAAQTVTKSTCPDHTTPIFARQYWLPIEKRVEYNILVTTFKAQYLGYISDLILPHHPLHFPLDLHLLHQTRSWTKSHRNKSFTVVG